ncbi:MAG: hypothetical protein EZS28_027128 [Streblomastix strix]|uniref:Uncharacterized protein n=1 Tax=Streblomastix strix TaxID=222440 RepID=A0A5J4V483_9EUKA|nr:MAG: hypothetical protein EZS28_027128 [Streblomastix strix]
MEENSGCECSEQGNTNNSFQDEWNRSSERFDQERKLGNKLRSKISLSPPNCNSTSQTIPSIQSNGKSIPIQSNAIWNTTFPNLLRTSLSNGLNEDTERIRYKNIKLRRRSVSPTLRQKQIENADVNYYEHFRRVRMDYSTGKMRNKTQTIDKFPRMVLEFEQNVSEGNYDELNGNLEFCGIL